MDNGSEKIVRQAQNSQVLCLAKAGTYYELLQVTQYINQETSLVRATFSGTENLTNGYQSYLKDNTITKSPQQQKILYQQNLF